MTRVIAGVAGGRRLAVPGGRATRPTGDRTREGLFGTVLAVLGALDGARVLDLYAGSGAVGLEALSRGADEALLVESDPRAASVVKANIAALGLPGARLRRDRVARVLTGGVDGGRYDLVFCDPPYALADTEVTEVLAMVLTGGWAAPGALLAVERATRGAPVEWPAGCRPDRSRRYGDATLWYGRDE